MKESRRHRWVGIATKPHVALCRDCGLETSPNAVRHGGFGDCPGKMVERQHGLALISGDPQALGNMNTDKFVMVCVGCGADRWLHMIDHRNPEEEVTGYVFACVKCCKSLADCQVEIMPRKKEGKDGPEGSEEGPEDGDSTPRRPGGEAR